MLWWLRALKIENLFSLKVFHPIPSPLALASNHSSFAWHFLFIDSCNSQLLPHDFFFLLMPFVPFVRENKEQKLFSGRVMIGSAADSAKETQNYCQGAQSLPLSTTVRVSKELTSCCCRFLLKMNFSETALSLSRRVNTITTLYRVAARNRTLTNLIESTMNEIANSLLEVQTFFDTDIRCRSICASSSSHSNSID